MLRATLPRLARALASVPGPPTTTGMGTFDDLIARNGGSMDDLNRNIAGIFSDYVREYGELFALDFPGQGPFLVCANPQAFQTLIQTEGQFPSGATETFWPMLKWYQDDGRKLAEEAFGRGPKWKEWRHRLQPEMTPPLAARRYLPHINAGAERAVPHLGKYADDLDTWVSRAALQMFCAVMLGRVIEYANPDAVSEEERQFIVDSRDAFTFSSKLILNGADPAKRATTPDYIRVAQAMEGQIAYAGKLCASLAEELRSGKGDELGRTCVIARMMAKGILDAELTDNVAQLLAAGVDTTGYVLNWLLLNLAQHPEVQEKLRDEVGRLSPSGAVTAEQIDQMEYLRAVVRESHRYTPPSHIPLIKEAIQNVEICGYAIPKGTKVYWSTHYFQDESIVDDPGSFRPERFLPDAVQLRKGTPQELLDHKLMRDPFGAGARMCLGGRIATLELYTALIWIMRQWRVSMPPGQKWDTRMFLMTKADPFPKFTVTALA
eukprot:TRINITY_DN13203_c0_g1_i1.p2 TRINITY_DN13203_c0_g1~~TRINITY_DN13203_c0_g1_i1.p2  ORF type:complete len:492 (+),score=133.12 TRINITY_DN13203_c0_g1_i1:91-1566(+)